MGSANNADDENPVHTVHLDAFYIDVYPVTNADYKKFVDANPQWRKANIEKKYHDGDYLAHWDGDDYPREKADHPVVHGELVRSDGVCEVGGQAASNRGRMGKSGARWIGRPTISVGKFGMIPRKQ